jgi:hypothetical protein
MFADQGRVPLFSAIGLGLFPALLLSVSIACTGEQSSEEGTEPSQEREQAVSKMTAAEQSDSPCEGVSLAERSISASVLTKHGLTARLEALRNSCAESLCRDLANTYDGGSPSKVAGDKARQIVARQARDKLYDGQGPCLDVARRCLEYQRVQGEVVALREMVDNPLELQHNYEKLVNAARRSDAVLQEFLSADDAQLLLQNCRDNAYSAAKNNAKTSTFAAAEALYAGAMACDRELPDGAAWNRTKSKRVEREVERVKAQRAQAERRAERQASAGKGGGGGSGSGQTAEEETDDIALVADIVRKMAKEATPRERQKIQEISELIKKMEKDPRFNARVRAAADCVSRCQQGAPDFFACATACSSGL